MRLPFTRQTLLDWAGSQVFGDAMNLWRRGSVRHAQFDPPLLTGRVEWGTRQIRTAVRIDADGSAENQCPCHDSRDRGIICAHVIALGLAMLEQAFDPRRAEREREERRRAERRAQVDDTRYLRRASPREAGAVPARLRLQLAADWRCQAPCGSVDVECRLAVNGSLFELEAAPRSHAYALSSADEALLFVWEDIGHGAPASRLRVSAADLINLLELRRGGGIGEEGSEAPIPVRPEPSSPCLRVSLDPESGELTADLQWAGSTEEPAVYVVAGRKGWVYASDGFQPLAVVLPVPFHGLYRGPVRIPREGAPQFVRSELPALRRIVSVESDLTEDSFMLAPDRPRFRLVIRGSAAALSATAYAEYGDMQFALAKDSPAGHFARPDPDDLMSYRVRALDQERQALRHLDEVGLQGPSGDDLRGLVGTRQVYNFLGRDLPSLRRDGWRVDLNGRVAAAFEDLRFVTPLVHIEESGPNGSFDVRLAYEDSSGRPLTGSEIQWAIRKGESYLDRDGDILLLDSEAIESMQRVFEDCASGEGRKAGSFRLPAIYAPYVKASLDAIDGIDVEASPHWLQRADRFNRLPADEPPALPGSLNGCLRPYQVAGVQWLGFLDRHAFGGILADDMGLGKTVQALTWLLARRRAADARQDPGLIVCPTSLVENWAEESARWTPELSVLVIAGSKRDSAFEHVTRSDLVITSYALLRRDLERYAPFTFSAMILDEAQHIKNHSTQNAKAAKAIRAERRLVLTGTPIENSVSDLWSIMDFLMPGYLGDHLSFREHYEQPIARGNRESAVALARLRRKLQPFLLRRLKRDVATELPPKIERVARFQMSPDQRNVYQHVLRDSQRRLVDLVARHGFERSRMEVLSTLLRLRQICCHVDLAKLAGPPVEQPSAKLELFFELLDEALDGGHRMLVFSQFVAMLSILRTELDRRGVTYCYLDGSTTNRQAEVNRFNRQPEIPLFLISLKAGGTGLNLTGADMVIHFDPWWNPAVEAQATDRAYRIGQHRTVYSIKLIARDSIEEKVLALQARKRMVIDAALEPDHAAQDALNWEDVQRLLDL